MQELLSNLRHELPATIFRVPLCARGSVREWDLEEVEAVTGDRGFKPPFLHVRASVVPLPDVCHQHVDG